MITATGLGSGLDIDGLVTQLVAAERSSSDLQLNRENAKLNSKFSALGTIKSGLAAFQSSLSGLKNFDSFEKFTASSANSEEVSVSVDGKATANTYSLEVSQLATKHSLASTAFEDPESTVIGGGTLTFRFGTTDYNTSSSAYNSFTLNPESQTSSIVIDETNNTLEGIMETINDAEMGVNASIVNDGTGFRLLMTSESSGEANSIEISVLDDDGNDTNTAGLSALSFNSNSSNIAQTSSSQDAQFTINGLEINSTSNDVDFAISGVTLNLNTVTEEPVEINISADNSSVISTIEKFIGGYNQYIETVNSLSSYNAEEDIPGALLGDFAVRSINDQINRVLRNSVEGVNGSVSTLSEIGITTDSDGKLGLNESSLKNALEESPDDVMSIFAAMGASSHNGVSFQSSTADTVVGDYAVEVTALATSGAYSGTGNLPNYGAGGSTVIDGNNNEFSIEVDGLFEVPITLTQGTYSSGESLASEMQARINGSDDMKEKGVSVAVAYDSVNNNFSITSNSLGSTSSVNISAVDINTTVDLGFSVSDGVVGQNIAGTIGGVEAIGVGNVLKARFGTDAQGLSLDVNASTTGSYGSINFTRGLADQLGGYLEQILDTESAFESRLNAIQGRIDDVADRRAVAELRWEAIETRYLQKFNALDILLSNMESTSSYLETQLDNLVPAFAGR